MARWASQLLKGCVLCSLSEKRNKKFLFCATFLRRPHASFTAESCETLTTDQRCQQKRWTSHITVSWRTAIRLRLRRWQVEKCGYGNFQVLFFLSPVRRARRRRWRENWWENRRPYFRFLKSKSWHSWWKPLDLTHVRNDIFIHVCIYRPLALTSIH